MKNMILENTLWRFYGTLVNMNWLDLKFIRFILRKWAKKNMVKFNL